MLISFLFLIILYNLIRTTHSIERKYFSLLVIIIYVFFSMWDYYWLINVDNYPFHPSDPSDYYTETKGLSLKQVLGIESSNQLYFVINWYYNSLWYNPYFISFLVKLNNILIFVSAYLLLTRKAFRFTYVDVLLLLNPYTIMTLVRNVRDAYILLFIAMIVVGMGMIPNNRIKKKWLVLAIFLMSITRAVLLIVFALIFVIKYWKRIPKPAQYIILIFAFVSCGLFWTEMVKIVSNQFISAMSDMGEDIEQYLPLLSGEVSLSILQSLLQRIIIALAVFLFTPHPFNFISDWVDGMDSTGALNIYTGFDNFLISCGTIYNYIFIIPIILAYFLNWRRVDKLTLALSIGFIVLYVVAYLGSTDIRNRNTAIFIILSSIIACNINLKIIPRYYLYTIGIFSFIYFFSN